MDVDDDDDVPVPLLLDDILDDDDVPAPDDDGVNDDAGPGSGVAANDAAKNANDCLASGRLHCPAISWVI